MDEFNLEEIVRQYVPLPANPTAKGWYTITCQVCHDHKYKKRGAWKFDNGKTAYHCFNCAAKGTFDDNVCFLSDDMAKVLTAYGIPPEYLSLIKFKALEKRGTKSKAPVKIDISTEPDALSLPNHFYKLVSGSTDVWSIMAEEYLVNDRGMSVSDYQFYLSRDKDWKGRLIIPFYKDEKLIFYQGRDLTDTKPSKYLNVDVSTKDNVLYGYNQLMKQTELPLYIVEGFFDAHSIDGVAVLGNVMSDNQIKILNRSRRKKVVIPDRKGDGQVLALKALEAGWSISLPDIGNCKDVDEAVKKYGKLYIMRSIKDNTCSGLAAQTKLKLWCEPPTKPKRKITRKDIN